MKAELDGFCSQTWRLAPCKSAALRNHFAAAVNTPFLPVPSSALSFSAVAYTMILSDVLHSEAEPRYFCYGAVGGRILTVRFTLRGQVIRIIGAGFWRKGAEAYENR